MGEGGNVRKGGKGEGLSRDVYCGSKRREAGVQIWWRIANASFDPCNEAVVKSSAFMSRDLEQGRGGSSRFIDSLEGRHGSPWGRSREGIGLDKRLFWQPASKFVVA